MARNPKWSKRELEVLVAMYSDHTNEEIAEKLPGRTPEAVMRKAWRLGLRKGPVFYKKRGQAYADAVRLERLRTTKGYVLRYAPDHPYATKSGHVMEHRLVMEQVLGRYLRPTEVVHHINGIKDDNRPENLMVMDHSEHSRLHNRGRVLPRESRLKLAEKAKRRLADPTKHPSYKHIPPERLMEVLLETKSPTQAARVLGVTRKTIYNKLSYWNLEEWYRESCRLSG